MITTRMIGCNWKRMVFLYLLSAMYLGWIHGVDYNYEPLAEHDKGLNVIYSVNLRPFISNLSWNSARNGTIESYPESFSVLDCANLTLFGYYSYLLNGWFGSWFSFLVLLLLDIPFESFLLFDLIASGRKHSFTGILPSVSYYLIVALLVFGTVRAIRDTDLVRPDICSRCRNKRFSTLIEAVLIGLDFSIIALLCCAIYKRKAHRRVEKLLFEWR